MNTQQFLNEKKIQRAEKSAQRKADWAIEDAETERENAEYAEWFKNKKMGMKGSQNLKRD